MEVEETGDDIAKPHPGGGQPGGVAHESPVLKMRAMTAIIFSSER
jgi:hypothetical protein